jgi:hypothetical protein
MRLAPRRRPEDLNDVLAESLRVLGQIMRMSGARVIGLISSAIVIFIVGKRIEPWASWQSWQGERVAGPMNMSVISSTDWPVRWFDVGMSSMWG